MFNTSKSLDHFFCRPRRQRSQEERDDVLDAYKKCRGEMSAMIDSIMLATEGAMMNDVSCPVCCCGVFTVIKAVNILLF